MDIPSFWTRHWLMGGVGMVLDNLHMILDYQGFKI